VGVSLLGPVNAQGAQWGFKYIPVNAQPGRETNWIVLSLEINQEYSGSVLQYVDRKKPPSLWGYPIYYVP